MTILPGVSIADFLLLRARSVWETELSPGECCRALVEATRANGPMSGGIGPSSFTLSLSRPYPAPWRPVAHGALSDIGTGTRVEVDFRLADWVRFSTFLSAGFPPAMVVSHASPTFVAWALGVAAMLWGPGWLVSHFGRRHTERHLREVLPPRVVASRAPAGPYRG